MPEHFFDVSLRSSPVPPQRSTDTAPSSGQFIPVYYLHSFEQPFCTNPLCPCQFVSYLEPALSQLRVWQVQVIGSTVFLTITYVPRPHHLETK